MVNKLFILLVIAVLMIFVDHETSKTKYSLHTVNTDAGHLAVFRFDSSSGRIDRVVFRDGPSGILSTTDFPAKDVFDAVAKDSPLNKK